jgi:hypothetical protein
MNKFLMKTIPNSVLRTVSRQLLVAKKNSPHIFFGVGIVGTAASAVMACRATLKLGDTLEGIAKEIEENKLLRAIPEDSESLEAQAEQLHHHINTLHVYSAAGWKIAKLYATPAVIGAASIALLTGSHVQMTRRNSALMVAYAGLEKFFGEYRNRVKQEVGEEKELELYHGSTTELVKKESGEIVEGRVVNPNRISPYARFFDEYSPNWVRNPEYNRIFLEIQQKYANDRLATVGTVFLNEVYDWLGIPRSKAGALVGWFDGGDGDGYISFGMYDAWNSQFVNGNEPSILLDFNVDGVIYDKMK